jgi:predicted AAA+ superfamily ATPase
MLKVDDYGAIWKIFKDVNVLKPYYNNIMKRAVKAPKLYFLDTGFAAYLTKWNKPEVLEAGTIPATWL